MADPAICPKCGNTFDSTQATDLLEGLCPHCLAGVSVNESQVQVSGPVPPAASTSPFVASSPVAVGSTFRNLEVLELLGQGGMGVVYKARHTALNRMVALKILSPQYAASEEFIRRFEREAKILASLNHPNIVQIYDFGQEAGICFLAMEFVDGANLEALFEKKPSLNLRGFLNLLKGVTRGLQKVHSSGLVHRDIKPSNILIARDGTPKIGDFGLAFDTEDTRKVTETGVFLGTPDYVSPEHVQGKKVDGRSDLYALGVILYQGVAGRTPFSGSSATSILMKHVNEPPPPLYKFAPNAPPLIGEITRKLLAKNPASRYASARDLERDLDRVLEGLSAKGPSREAAGATGNRERPPLVSAKTTPLKSAGRRRRLYYGAAASALGIFALLGLLLFVLRKEAAPGRNDSAADTTPSRTDTDRSMPPPTFTEVPRGHVASSRDPRSSLPDPQPAQPSPEPAPKKDDVVDPDSASELSTLNPPERRRRLDHYASVANLAGIAAAYADARQMKEEAAKLRHTMDLTSKKIALLVALMTKDGQNAYVEDSLRSTDRLTNFENQDLDKIGKNQTIALLGTFVSKVRAGSRARVVLLRDGKVEEFVVRFDERQKELLTILQVVGLIPGQDVEVTLSPSPSALPAPSVPPVLTPEPKPSLGAAPAPGAKVPPPLPMKSRPPDSAAFSEAEKLVQEIFKDDYAKKAPSDRAVLAKKLLNQAKASNENGPEAFALLKEAREQAAQGADATTMLAAISELSRRFEINEMEMKITSLGLLAKAVKSPEDHAEFQRQVKHYPSCSYEEWLFREQKKMADWKSRRHAIRMVDITPTKFAEYCQKTGKPSDLTTFLKAITDMAF